jgi:hypothetical protein
MPGRRDVVVIDPESLQLATANCPVTRTEVYVAGSAPTQFCELHGGHSLLSSTGSFLSTFLAGSRRRRQRDGSTPPGVPYDPNRPPNATARVPCRMILPRSLKKRKECFTQDFGIFGGGRRTRQVKRRSRRREIRHDQDTNGVSSKHPPSFRLPHQDNHSETQRPLWLPRVGPRISSNRRRGLCCHRGAPRADGEADGRSTWCGRDYREATLVYKSSPTKIRVILST